MRSDHPSSAKRIKTAKQARAEFDRKGLSIAEWARTHGLGRSLVYEVLAGRRKCHRGASHRAAVLLGMKAGEMGAEAATHVADEVHA